ncbi:MAG: MarR family transcriptional regulator [Candidatus Methylomirabilales bacterium]
MVQRTAPGKLMLLDTYIRALAKRLYLRPAAKGVAAELANNEIFTCEALGRRGRCMMTELAKECGFPLSSMTGIVDRLVTKGYVKRFRNNEDRRSVFVALTKRGEHVYQDCLEAEMGLIIAMMDSLEPNEQDTLLDLLGKTVAGLGE